MIDDRDIWRAAELLVERYGDGAGAEAEKRVDELLSRGDAEGGAVWRRIQEAVFDLQTRLDDTREAKWVPKRSVGSTLGDV